MRYETSNYEIDMNFEERVLDATFKLASDDRKIIHGTVVNEMNEPIASATVEVFEILKGANNNKSYSLIANTFTDEYGEFVLGPVMPDISILVKIFKADKTIIKEIFKPSDVIDDDDPNEYLGPVNYQTELYIRENQKRKGTQTLIQAGTVSMGNTSEKFIIYVETTNKWDIEEISIYVGNEPIPISTGGAPKVKMFPYIEKLSTKAKCYKLELDLKDDLDLSWGQRDLEKRIQNVAIYTKLVEKDNQESTDYQEAWAYGENQFKANKGWWTSYEMCRPEKGHFVDSPVHGMNFHTKSFRGHTDTNGSFDYTEGEGVTFSIGLLQIGTTIGKHRISPLDLVGTNDLNDQRVLNMAQLLQSLDAKGDPTSGIEITEPVISCLNQAMNELKITTLDFADTDAVNSLIEHTVNISSTISEIDLNIISKEEARDNLEKSLSNTMFRKNISKTPDMENAKAKIELMPVYVPARKANDDPVELEYKDVDGELISTHTVAKPLVVAYAQEVPDTGGAMDVFAAISRDDGNTWKRKNLSRSADSSSFTLANGTEYPGDVKKPQCKVKGNKILVSWTSKYARKGNPRYAIKEEDNNPYYVDDIWVVGGSQRSCDYAKLDFPEVGEIPFSCVWTCRGTINTETGEITWFKPERLTSGRRDAFQLMFNGAVNAGYALVWQEDPEGLRPGEEAGPGQGWSGATTNHKTDIWYSYIKWDDFDIIDENFISGGDSENEDDEEIKERPKALVPCSLPIRLSDNETLNSDNLESHRYGLEIEGLCSEFYEKTNSQGEIKNICITDDGRLLDGDTGAARPNIMIQPYMKPDGSYSAWTIVCYEESKGVGSGPPENTSVSKDKDESGSGQDRYYPDRGKNIIYHSFDFTNPDLVSAGTILNPQSIDENGNLLYLKDENGNLLEDWQGNAIPAYENARRPRLIIQSKSKALGIKEDGTGFKYDEGTVLVCVFKMGEEGKGRPSDVFMHRWVIYKDSKGNPYDVKNMKDEIQNLSSVTPTETWQNPDSSSEEKESIKVIRWIQTEENLLDFSSTNPYDDARAQRGFIRGKFLAIAYDWTPNWSAARNGNDIYNLYIRRSFDGGETWTTDSDGTGVTHYETFKIPESKDKIEVSTFYGPGEFESARNVSQIKNNKISVIEPRLVGTPGTIKTNEIILYEEDKQNVDAFWVTYGTESNPGRNDEEEAHPLDLYYSYSDDKGETYYTVSKTINSESTSENAGEVVEVWDWLAKDTGKNVSEQAECQIRMNPEGSILFAVWNDIGETEKDVMFRRIMKNGDSIEEV